MVDSVSLTSLESVALQQTSAPMAQPMQSLDPAETKAFSVLMGDMGAGSGTVSQYKATSVQQPNELQRTIVNSGVELSHKIKSMHEEGQLLMADGGFGSDPMLYMRNIADFQYRAMQSQAQLHLTSSLVSAANNSFHTLFKNQG